MLNIWRQLCTVVDTTWYNAVQHHKLHCNATKCNALKKCETISGSVQSNPNSFSDGDTLQYVSKGGLCIKMYPTLGAQVSSHTSFYRIEQLVCLCSILTLDIWLFMSQDESTGFNYFYGYRTNDGKSKMVCLRSIWIDISTVVCHEVLRLIEVAQILRNFTKNFARKW